MEAQVYFEGVEAGVGATEKIKEFLLSFFLFRLSGHC